MASLFGSTPTRPLVLHADAARVSIPVAASPLSAWVASEVLAQEFHETLVSDAVIPDEDAEPTNEPQVKLLARFLAFAADKASASAEVLPVLRAAYDRFNELFLSTVNIHSLVQAFEPESRAEILKAYFKAFAVGRELGSFFEVAHASALLSAAKKGEAELYALFGGQGVNEVSRMRGLRLTISTTLTNFNLFTTHTPPLSAPSSPRSARSSSRSATRPRRTGLHTIRTASTCSRG